jgi:amidophosphoribosyltransferase
MRTECGIFAAMGYQIPPAFIDNGMRKIQHRGQDSYGIITYLPNTGRINELKEFGLIPDSLISNLANIGYTNDKQGDDKQSDNYILVLGHTRYSTVNATIDKEAIQPIELADSICDAVYVAFNGNIPNYAENMQKTLGITELEGSSDTFLFRAIWQKLALSLHSANTEVVVSLDSLAMEFARHCIQQIPGAYSCVVLVGNKLIGFRDRYGYKPLWYYRDMDLGLQGFVSETCQLSTSCQIREVPSGGYVILSEGTDPISYTVMTLPQAELSRCSMEAIYFMQYSSLIRYRSHSILSPPQVGENLVKRQCLDTGLETQCLRYDDTINSSASVRDIKYLLGQALAREELSRSTSKKLEPIRTQVIYVPESSYPLAAAYSEVMGMEFIPGVITKIYNIRSFIENNTDARVGKIKRKFEFDFSLITTPEVVIIDDSLVRGNTMKYIIGRLRESRPELKIHIRIASPIIKDKCWFGIDIAERDELIWWQTGSSLLGLLGYLDVASIRYLSVDGLMSVLGPGYCGFCFGADSQANHQTLDW